MLFCPGSLRVVANASFQENDSFAHRRRAFTLLEVIVGLTLMATMLVGSLLAFAAHQKQRRLADAKLLAVAVADDILNRMHTAANGIPQNDRGMIVGKPNWFWQTSVVGSISAAEVPMRVVRFQIIEQPNGQPFRALVTIDLVQPSETG